MIAPKVALVIQCIRYIALARVSVSCIKSSHGENNNNEKFKSQDTTAGQWSYQDEDGIATRESIMNFLDSTPRRSIICLLGLGVAAAASQTVLDSQGLKTLIAWVSNWENLVYNVNLTINIDTSHRGMLWWTEFNSCKL
jgi:hypothetical protein